MQLSTDAPFFELGIEQVNRVVRRLHFASVEDRAVPDRRLASHDVTDGPLAGFIFILLPAVTNSDFGGLNVAFPHRTKSSHIS